MNPRHAMGRGVCYCLDCQAYAQALGHPRDVVDAMGGTDVVAITASHVVFDQGIESLACLSLSPRGLLRWHTRCCATPVANTPRDWRIAYAGLVHNVLEGEVPVEASFGPVRARVNTAHAHGTASPTRLATLSFVLAAIARAGGARLSGRYRRSPFFARDGRPVAEPRVLTREERDAAYAAARANAGA